MIITDKRKKRKGLADRIQEIGQGTQSKVDRAAEVLKGESVSPAESVAQKAKILPSTWLFPPTNGFITTQSIATAYKYVEICRMRENIVSAVKKDNGKTVVFTGPLNNVGNTFLTCVVGLNAAFFTNMRVLLVDMDLGRPSLHVHFSLQREKGFAKVACESYQLYDVIKATEHSKLSIITVSQHRENSSRFLNKAFLKQFVQEIKKDFDIVIFDTSPVLINNKNNIDPVILSSICDATNIVVQDCKTTKSELRDTVAALRQAGGKVSGVIYNRQFSKSLSARALTRFLIHFYPRSSLASNGSRK